MNGIEFWNNVKKSGPDDCWEWQRGKNEKGYGLLTLTGVKHTQKAHRVAWMLTYGPIQPGVHVLHTCDNPGCCNPYHLFTGTNLDNVKDKMAKGRMQKGEKTSKAKLTEDMVRAIRLEYIETQTSCEKLAERYPVNPSSIFLVLTYRSWPHVAPELKEKIIMRPQVRRGADTARSKLSADQVLEIRQKVTDGETLKALAAEYGVARGSVWKIMNRQSWAHLA